MRLIVGESSGHPEFLYLPWDEPLASWTLPNLVNMPRGSHRHVVKFIDFDGSVYALKELPTPLAEREYRLLRELRDRALPSVQPVGFVTDRPDEQDDVIITRFLDFSLPYRMLFGAPGSARLTHQLIDALAGLMVRLHLVGFYWGDCSLNNALFRRDAGTLSAYVVDVETGELHERLSNGQRQLDLDLAMENLMGGLFDLQAGGRLPEDFDIVQVGDELRASYDDLWEDVTVSETFAPEDTYRLQQRVDRLHELGFDVAEMELQASDAGEPKVRFVPRVVELGYHRHRLMALTGIDAEENQARRLLSDIERFRVRLEQSRGRATPEPIAAARWLDEVFEPTAAQIPEDLRDRMAPTELFHQVLEHRWFLSEQVGRDVGHHTAVASFITNVLRPTPAARTAALDGGAASDDGLGETPEADAD